MAKRLLLVVLLGVAASVLIGLVVLDGGKKSTRPLLALTPAAINRIRIERRPPRRPIALRRLGKHWRLVEPRTLPASVFQVQRVLHAARMPTEESDVLKGAQAKRLGLDPPQVRLILNHKAIEFGDLDPLTHRRYIRSEGRTFLLLEGLEPLLAGPWWNFISRRLLPGGGELTELWLPRIALSRVDGVWHAHGAGNLGPKRAKALVRAWRDSYAAIVEPLANPPNSGLSVQARLNDGRTLRWLVVSGDPAGLYRPDQHLLYELDSGALRRLLGRQAQPVAPRPRPVTADAGRE